MVAAAAVRRLTRAVIVIVLVAAPTIWYACSESAPESPAGPAVVPSVLPRRTLKDLHDALAALRRYAPELLKTPGVVGTAVTTLPDGRAGVLILAERTGLTQLPDTLDGVPVKVRVTDRAHYDATKLAIALLAAIRAAHPSQFQFRNDSIDRLAAGHELRQQIEAGRRPSEISQEWERDLARFREFRGKYLIY